MAGESADEVARRAREKADRLIKRAEAFEKGATGERLVAEVLERLPSDWFVLNDRRWPGRTRANIDHVVVGPAGVFIIDAKNWSGSVAVKNGVLRQNGYSRMNAIDAALESARALAALCDWIPAGYFIPVLCFVGGGRVDSTVNGVEVCSLERLPRVLQNRPARLAPETLQFLRFDLDMAMSDAAGAPMRSAVAQSRRSQDGLEKTGDPSLARRPTHRTDRTPRLARFGLAFFWFAVGSLLFGATLPAAGVSHDTQGLLGVLLLIGCVTYYFRKR